MTAIQDADLLSLLERVPTRRMNRRLVRGVPQLHFDAGKRPGYIYTSGWAKRFNPAGVDCLYFSESEATADAEYRRPWRHTIARHQPKLTFTARVHLLHIVDLSDDETMRLLGITRDDLQGNWRRHTPTRLQQLGREISRQHSITAIRYPSNAAARLGRAGWNVAIYLSALEHPNRIEILSDSDDPLETLP